MRGWLKNTLAAVLVASTAPAVGSCTDSDTGVFVIANLARVAPSCAIKVALDSASYARGTLDVTLRDYYVADLMWGNQMIERNDEDLLRTETDRFVMEGAIVELFHGETQLRRFSVATSGVASPTASVDPGLGLSQVELIPADVTINQIEPLLTNPSDRVQIIVNVKLYGSTLGGISTESPPFTYVVDVCRSCLIAFPPNFSETTEKCKFSADVTAPCYIGQNDPVPCQACVNEFPPEPPLNPCLLPQP